jgi:hypothetical protein
VIHAEYRKRGRKPDLGLDEPDYLCFLAYARITLEHALAACPSVSEVDFVVSLKGKTTDHVKTFHGELKRLVEPPYKDLVGDLIPASMEKRLPLQAADVLCWHFQRFFGGRMNRIDEGRLARLGDKIGKHHQWKREDLEHLAKQWFG